MSKTENDISLQSFPSTKITCFYWRIYCMWRMNFNEIIFIAVGNNPLMCHSDSMLFVNRDAVIVAQVPLQKNSSQEKIDFNIQRFSLLSLSSDAAEWTMPVFATKSTFERLRLKNKNIVQQRLLVLSKANSVLNQFLVY